jgi:hypothetical protein
MFFFRTLLYDLIHLDGIEFYTKLISHKMRSGQESIWIIADADPDTKKALENLVNYSKSRVFSIKKKYLQDEKKPGENDENTPDKSVTDSSATKSELTDSGLKKEPEVKPHGEGSIVLEPDME